MDRGEASGNRERTPNTSDPVSPQFPDVRTVVLYGTDLVQDSRRRDRGATEHTQGQEPKDPGPDGGHEVWKG